MKDELKIKLDEQTYIHVLVSTELKKELVKEAQAKQMALATYIRMLLLERNDNK